MTSLKKELYKWKNSVLSYKQETITIIDFRRTKWKRDRITAGKEKPFYLPSVPLIFIPLLIGSIQKLKPIYPDLSLGTVYRNIARFKEDGLIISVGVVEGQERLDGTTAPHAHFICSKCGCVLDVEDVEQNAQLDFDVSKRIRCQIDSHDLVFHGICEECLNAQKNAG